MIGPGSSLSFLVPSRFADVRLLGISVRALFKELLFDSSLTYQLELAVVEAGNNIVHHAYQKNGKYFFHMEFAVTKKQVSCTFIDQGKSKDFLAESHTLDPCVDPAFLLENHRGVCLICEIMDEVDYTQKGKNNILTIKKNLPES